MHPDNLYEQQHWWLGRVHQDLQCGDKYLEQRVLEQTRCQIKRQQNTKSLTNSCVRQAMVSTKEVTDFITYVLKGKWALLVKVIWSTYTKKQAPSTRQPFSPEGPFSETSACHYILDLVHCLIGTESTIITVRE